MNPPAVASLPGIPVIDPEKNLDARDLRKAVWALNRAPEMAYMLRGTYPNLPFFARLNFSRTAPPIVKNGAFWEVTESLRDSWQRLELTLIGICEAISPHVHNLKEALLPFDCHWPLPSYSGYLARHKSEGSAIKALWKSRDAFLLLTARCSLMISLSYIRRPPRQHELPLWEECLDKAHFEPAFIDELRQSKISDLSPDLRVGAFMSPMHGELGTMWMNHFECMVRANIPVYVYWPEPGHNTFETSKVNVLKKYPFLMPYAPDFRDFIVVQSATPERVEYRRGHPVVVAVQTQFRWEDYPRLAQSSVQTQSIDELVRNSVPSTTAAVVPPTAPGNSAHQGGSPHKKLPHGIGQRPGESFEQYRARRSIINADAAKNESSDEREKRLQRERVAAKFDKPSRNTYVYLWCMLGDVDPTVDPLDLTAPFRKHLGKKAVSEVWMCHPNSVKHYDSFLDVWDICPEDDFGKQFQIDPHAYDELFEPDFINDAQRGSESIAQITARELDAFHADKVHSYSEPFRPSFEHVTEVLLRRYGIYATVLSEKEKNDSLGAHYRHNSARVEKHFSLPDQTLSPQNFKDVVYAASAIITKILHKPDPKDAVTFDLVERAWDLADNCPSFLALPGFYYERLVVTRWSNRNALWCSVSYVDERDCDFVVLVGSTTAVELLRRPEIKDRRGVVDFCVSRGIACQTPYDPHPTIIIPRSLVSSTFDDCLGWRDRAWKATTRDYDAYLDHAHDILSQPRGRAALLRGGIVWRLALEILRPQAIWCAGDGPSSDVHIYGQVIAASHGNSFYDDGLSDAEIDIICGTYKMPSKS